MLTKNRLDRNSRSTNNSSTSDSDIQERTRYSNTGLNRQKQHILSLEQYLAPELKAKGIDKPEVFIDWSTLNARPDDAKLTLIIEQFLIGAFWGQSNEVDIKTFNKPINMGGVKFKEKITSPNGVVCYVTEDYDEDGNNIVQLKLTGDTQAGLFQRDDMLEYARFAHLCDQLGLSPSRIDIAVQDSQKRLDILQCIQESVEGNLTGVRKFSAVISGEVGKIDGLTWYGGSRQSDSYYRNYDTFAKHGEIGNRLENELKDKKAKEFFAMLVKIYSTYLSHLEQTKSIASMQCHDDNSFADMVRTNQKKAFKEETEAYRITQEYRKDANIMAKAVVIGGIKFIDSSKKGKNGNLSKCEVLPFYQSFTEYILEDNLPIKLRPVKKKITLRDKFKWVHKAVKGTLGIMAKGLPANEFIDSLKYLLLEDRNKKYPKQVQKDRDLLVGELREFGIDALMDKEHLDKAINEYSLDFATGQYVEQGGAICFDTPDIIAGNSKTKFYEYIEDNPEFLRPIHEQHPLIFEVLMKFLRWSEREIIEGYLNDWKEPELDNSKISNRALLV